MAPDGKAAPSKTRVARYRRGLIAEFMAALALSLKGYRILKRRYKTPMGEIDIIAKRFNRIAFVEVKARKDEAEARISITPRAQHRIRQAAQAWLKSNPRYKSCTIGLDAMLVTPGRWPKHLTDTFDHV